MLEALTFGSDSASLNCSFILNSAKNKLFTKTKCILTITQQISAISVSFLLNSDFGLKCLTSPQSALENLAAQLQKSYLKVSQIGNKKICVT